MDGQNIPKIIHYCWCGGKQKPSKIQKCINSWHKYLRDYEFMEWNESNFDVNCND
ncbi:glycosyl transferase, partial [Clostridium perfringens]|nr:glycosyl transferase [Clostridium perfringens]